MILREYRRLLVEQVAVCEERLHQLQVRLDLLQQLRLAPSVPRCRGARTSSFCMTSLDWFGNNSLTASTQSGTVSCDGPRLALTILLTGRDRSRPALARLMCRPQPPVRTGSQRVPRCARPRRYHRTKSRAPRRSYREPARQRAQRVRIGQLFALERIHHKEGEFQVFNFVPCVVRICHPHSGQFFNTAAVAASNRATSAVAARLPLIARTSSTPFSPYRRATDRRERILCAFESRSIAARAAAGASPGTGPTPLPSAGRRRRRRSRPLPSISDVRDTANMPSSRSPA